ncbi:MAG: PIN domain-containing protein [Deinococcales bacterium]
MLGLLIESYLLFDLIADGLAPIRQEVLSGIRHQEQFEKLRLSLRAFPDMPLEMQDYELAAQYFNRCRGQGIQASNTDFLICAASVNYDCEILTTDRDFYHFSTFLPIKLYS